MKRIARVFPRRTRATPTDDMAFTTPPLLWTEADEVHVSVTFDWDIEAAELLARQWKSVANVKLGGPAMMTPGADFEPGMYLATGYTITSRGCPNRCWFCKVWKRDGEVTELPIRDGYDLLDDNLLACSEQHIRKVFAMLSRQERRPKFTGGLEAKRMTPWIASELRRLNPEQLFFAFDTEDDLEPLFEAGKMLNEAGFRLGSHSLRAYVLIGFPKDTIPSAETRLRSCSRAGFLPMAMLWREGSLNPTIEWKRFQRKWARPAITSAILKA